MLVEFVMVSISPVPKFDPGPVSYVQFADEGGLPAGPPKSSLNTSDQSDCARNAVGLDGAALAGGAAIATAAEAPSWVIATTATAHHRRQPAKTFPLDDSDTGSVVGSDIGGGIDTGTDLPRGSEPRTISITESVSILAGCQGGDRLPHSPVHTKSDTRSPSSGRFSDGQ
ncbi:MAG TPA: hypothetical protein VF444_02665 [Pseudonocardiaceae bacterium]